jgi:Tfp pilus assembly protein PilF
VLYQRSLHDSARAATAYKRALSLDPTYRSAMFDLAIVDTPTAPQDALNLYNELLLRNPNDADVNFNLGLLLIVLKQPVPGHAALKRAVTLNPALARRLPAGITP